MPNNVCGGDTIAQLIFKKNIPITKGIYLLSTGFAAFTAIPLGANTILSSSSLTASPPGPVFFDMVEGNSFSGVKSTTRSSLTAKTVSVASHGSSAG